MSRKGMISLLKSIVNWIDVFLGFKMKHFKLRHLLPKFKLLFSNINETLSKRNSLENLVCKDLGNLSSQCSIASRPYSWGIF